MSNSQSHSLTFYPNEFKSRGHAEASHKDVVSSARDYPQGGRTKP